MAFGFGANGAVTVHSTPITFFFGKLRVILVSGRSDPPGARRNRLRLEAGNQYRCCLDHRHTQADRTRARYGGASKVAVTDCGPLIVTTHSPVPLQAPLHPWNADGKSVVAVSVTGVPGG
jgi:hypothetical protein